MKCNKIYCKRVYLTFGLFVDEGVWFFCRVSPILGWFRVQMYFGQADASFAIFLSAVFFYNIFCGKGS